MGNVAYELNDPPEGIGIQSASSERGSTTIVLRADAAKVKAGLEGNLIVEAFAEHAPDARGDEPSAKKRRIPLGALPAIPFEVVAP